MNFRDSYKQINENRKPDKEFLNQLAEKMDAQQQKSKKNNTIPFIISTGLTAVAAVICFLFIRPNNTPSQLPSQDISLKADPVESITPEHEFEHQDLLVGSENTEELLSTLQMLLSNEEVKTAYCADINTFEKEDTLSVQELKSLTASIMNAQTTTPNIQGKCKYYMLIFANNSIVKFEIYDSKYLKIKDDDTVYLLFE